MEKFKTIHGLEKKYLIFIDKSDETNKAKN